MLFLVNELILYTPKVKRKNDICGGGKLEGSENESKGDKKAEKQPKKKIRKKRFTKSKLGRKGKRRHSRNKKGICFQFYIENPSSSLYLRNRTKGNINMYLINYYKFEYT